MEKTTKTTTYFAHFVFNASMPKNIRSKARTFTLHHNTENHKAGDKVTIEAKQPKDVPFSIPGVKYILETNKVEIAKIDNRHFMIVESTKEALTAAIEKIKSLFKDNQISGITMHPITQEKKKRKKDPSNNKPSTGAPKKRNKFEKKTLESKLPRKMKKAAQKEAVEYTLTLLNEMNDTHLSKSQLKRAKNRIALIEFVNAVCDQKFTTYAETMRFIRNHNKDEMMKIAA